MSLTDSHRVADKLAGWNDRDMDWKLPEWPVLVGGDQSFKIQLEASTSSVHQGSTLGPVLFLIWMMGQSVSKYLSIQESIQAFCW